MFSRENEGSEREMEGVGQDMSIPQIFSLRNLFSETSALSTTSI